MKFFHKKEPTLDELRKPVTEKQRNRNNEDFLNEVMTQMRNEKVNDLRYKRADPAMQDCYRKAALAYRLYACLNEEDDERLRELIQDLADTNLNDVVSYLASICYTF